MDTTIYTGNLLSLIDLEIPEFPIRLRKVRRIMRHEITTRSRAMVLLRVELRLGAQVPAKGDVGHDALISKMRGYVAVCIGEVGERGTPGRGVWTTAGVGDVVGDRIPGEEPGANACIAKF